MNRRRAPTIRDVASFAGVSVTTVSDVVNGKGRVDPDTRKRVIAAVDEVGWRPRRSARALRSGQSGVFALCLPQRDHSVGDWLLNADYDMALVAACAAAAVDSDRQLLLAPRPKDVTDLVRLDVDGVIIADPQEGDLALTVLNGAGIPVVTIERDLRRTDGWWVETDTVGSTYMVLDHLAAQGAERIALIGSDAPWAWFSETIEAYTTWCEEREWRPQIRLIDVNKPTTSAAAAVRRLLRLRRPPDAIFAQPQGAPLSVLAAATAAGRRVPDDLMLVAGIDGQTLQLAHPPITALDLRPVEIARAAIDLLARRVAGADTAGPEVVEAKLVTRQSTLGHV
ncbi:MAG TPA: LacI family DNA-binding transcriptional regulator [Nocardioidaceae bacterium]|nr:LacI family DNA-binding transcriptional regulator [Nocardioidaceae bacterium]